MPDRSPAWALANFAERFDAWADQQKPSDDLRVTVAEWILTRFDDPYLRARREPGFDNLWFARVPGSQHDDGNVVVCSYWIHESTRTVSCDSFATLGLPLL